MDWSNTQEVWKAFWENPLSLASDPNAPIECLWSFYYRTGDAYLIGKSPATLPLVKDQVATAILQNPALPLLLLEHPLETQRLIWRCQRWNLYLEGRLPQHWSRTEGDPWDRESAPAPSAVVASVNNETDFPLLVSVTLMDP